VGWSTRPVESHQPDSRQAAAITSHVDCGRFEADPELAQYCAYLDVQDEEDPEAVIAGCQASGPWEQACRGEWVGTWGRGQTRFDVPTLLRVCGENHDCAFDVLEVHASGDVLVEVDACERHTGPHASDCVGHSLNRWLARQPDADQVARLAALDTPHAEAVGGAVAHAVFCLGAGTCAGSESVTAHCERSVEALKNRPGSCPETDAPPPPPPRRPVILPPKDIPPGDRPSPP